jgi:hypothetical protein
MGMGEFEISRGYGILTLKMTMMKRRGTSSRDVMMEQI